MENLNVLKLEHQIFSDFYLCYCGYGSCQPLQHFGPAVRPNYLIHFITDGKGIFQSGDKQVSLHAGEGFIIRPNEQAFF